jgi:hypothetical protein
MVGSKRDRISAQGIAGTSLEESFLNLHAIFSLRDR